MARQGVIVYFRIIDGEIRRGDKIKFMANSVEREVGGFSSLVAET